MKKLLVVLLCVCLLVIGHMVGTKDTNVTADKVYTWAREELPKKIANMYTIKSYNIVENEDGTVDIVLHCDKNNNEEN